MTSVVFLPKHFNLDPIMRQLSDNQTCMYLKITGLYWLATTTTKIQVSLGKETLVN